MAAWVGNTRESHLSPACEVPVQSGDSIQRKIPVVLVRRGSNIPTNISHSMCVDEPSVSRTAADVTVRVSSESLMSVTVPLVYSTLENVSLDLAEKEHSNIGTLIVNNVAKSALQHAARAEYGLGQRPVTFLVMGVQQEAVEEVIEVSLRDPVDSLRIFNLPNFSFTVK